MRASAKIRSSLRGGTGGTVAGGDDVAFVAFVGAAAASVLLLGVFRVTHLLSRRRAFALRSAGGEETRELIYLCDLIRSIHHMDRLIPKAIYAPSLPKSRWSDEPIE